MNKPSARFIALASMALAFLAACGPKEDTQVDTALGSVAPAATVTITQIEIGKSIGADKRVTSPMMDFTKTDTIYAVVSTDGAAPSATLQAKWTFEDGQVVDESTQTIAPTGPAVTEFHISKPDGFLKGKYTVQILLNGVPTGSKDFTVK